MGRKRGKGRRRGKGGRAEEAADDKVLFPCARQKPGNEAKPKGIPGNKAKKLQEQLVGGIVKR